MLKSPPTTLEGWMDVPPIKITPISEELQAKLSEEFRIPVEWLIADGHSRWASGIMHELTRLSQEQNAAYGLPNDIWFGNLRDLYDIIQELTHNGWQPNSHAFLKAQVITKEQFYEDHGGSRVEVAEWRISRALGIEHYYRSKEALRF